MRLWARVKGRIGGHCTNGPWRLEGNGPVLFVGTHVISWASRFILGEQWCCESFLLIVVFPLSVSFLYEV